MTHAIVWEWERGSVHAEAVCDDVDCISRYVCDYPCESYPNVRRDYEGVSHGGYDDTAATPRHIMHNAGECNVLLFLNADSWLLPELNDDDQKPFEIGRVGIEPVWENDGVLWRATSIPACVSHPDEGKRK